MDFSLEVTCVTNNSGDLWMNYAQATPCASKTLSLLAANVESDGLVIQLSLYQALLLECPLKETPLSADFSFLGQPSP